MVEVPGEDWAVDVRAGHGGAGGKEQTFVTELGGVGGGTDDRVVRAVEESADCGFHWHFVLELVGCGGRVGWPRSWQGWRLSAG